MTTKIVLRADPTPATRIMGDGIGELGEYTLEDETRFFVRLFEYGSLSVGNSDPVRVITYLLGMGYMVAVDGENFRLTLPGCLYANRLIEGVIKPWEND